ncbi:hypothetical protein [Nonomuraea jabiensis]|uniref:hypothetical protein n=1 Tax=Nonomuraea jabiensis TaxID=882448 RepID=UPI003D705224
MVIVSRIEAPIAAVASPASRPRAFSCRFSEVTGKFQHTREGASAGRDLPVDNRDQAVGACGGKVATLVRGEKTALWS